MALLLIVLMILLALGGIGIWPSVGYYDDGYVPSGLLFVSVIVVLIVLLRRRRRV